MNRLRLRRYGLEGQADRIQQLGHHLRRHWQSGHLRQLDIHLGERAAAEKAGAYQRGDD